MLMNVSRATAPALRLDARLIEDLHKIVRATLAERERVFRQIESAVDPARAQHIKDAIADAIKNPPARYVAGR